MAEHYKLNLFDINLDSFDVKIGFGDDPTITMKNIDIYYAYNSSANFVWYKSYSPNIIATGLSLLFAAHTIHILEDEDDIYFNHFIFTIYLLVFIFTAKIKIFPQGTQQEQYDRFVNIFRSFYEHVFENTGTSIDTKTYNHIKTLFFDEIKTLFALFYIYKDLGNYFSIIDGEDTEFIKRLLAGDFHHKIHETITKQYVEVHQDLCRTTSFGNLEKKIIDLILPADILIRYLFGDSEWPIIAKHILATIYDPAILDELMESFLSSGMKAKECIEYSINFTTLKQNFFFWLQHYIKAKIEDFKASASDQSMPVHEEEMDEFLSFLSDNDQIDPTSLPWNVQIQTITLDKLINFYISFIGWFWVAKGDSGYLRLYKPDLLGKLLQLYPIFWSSSTTIQFYARYFRLYEKNVFYYQYIFNHVRSGKDSFVLPTTASIISHESNIFIIQLYNESSRSILLQDSYHNDIKLYIKKPEILDTFKDHFGAIISTFLKDRDLLLKHIYQPYDHIGKKNNVSDSIISSLSDSEISIIKDRMYCLDFWIFEDIKHELMNTGILSHYETPIALGILALLKETIFWCMLYLQYIISSEESHQKDYSSSCLIDIYCQTLLQLQPEHATILTSYLKALLNTYEDIIMPWVLLDDNQDYMYIWFNNRNTRIEQKNKTDLSSYLTDEDIIWYLWYLKHITYYNRRFLIPYT